MKLRTAMFGTVLTIMGLFAFNGVSNVSAVSCPPGSKNASANTYQECDIEKTTGNDSLMYRISQVINVLIGIVGVISVIMIIIGGVTYATSQGDAQKTKRGTQTIIFSLIGLIVAILAFAIVNFVLDGVFNTSLN